MGRMTSALGAGVSLGLACAIPQARAQAPDDFWRGKTITVAIGAPAGGGFDLAGRLMARHLGKHMPGKPNLVAQNMPGASGVRVLDWVWSVAPKDGTAMGITLPSAYLSKVLEQNAEARPHLYTWVGRIAAFRGYGVVWKSAPAQTFEDARRTTLSLGAEGPTGLASMTAAALNDLAGSKFNIVRGYTGGPDQGLAMERGEIQGSGSMSWEYLDQQGWVKDAKVRFLFTIALKPYHRIPDVPVVADLVPREEDKPILRLIASSTEIGRAFIAPPGVPAERARALREGFMAMLKDPEFEAEADKLKLELEGLSGDEMQALVSAAMNVPQTVADRTRAYAPGLK
ncbi:MAG: tripartite tricarboxylate transporter family receptor [Hyphomicrobiales bacterium]|nr:tripartite tricarboxylate transporter family receptor [Hyphomicrobiales bacterium]